MSVAKNSTQVLKAAKWILENIGWIKGEPHRYDEQGNFMGFCANAALFRVEVESEEIRLGARARLIKAMGTNVIDFNDNKKTTKKMVLNAFDQAIKKGSKK